MSEILSKLSADSRLFLDIYCYFSEILNGLDICNPKDVHLHISELFRTFNMVNVEVAPNKYKDFYLLIKYFEKNQEGDDYVVGDYYPIK